MEKIHRVGIVATHQRFYVGSMDAQIGMMTDTGEIIRLTKKQYITKGAYELRRGANQPNACITVTEAKRFGWKPTAEQAAKIAQWSKEYH